MRKPWIFSSFLLGVGIGTGLVCKAVVKHQHRLNLHDRVVLITGGSKGLGLALARKFTDEGAKVSICARSQKPLELAREKLESSGKDVLAIACDVREPEQVRLLVEQTIAHYGRIDILVNNAGIIIVGPQETMTIDDYADTMDTMFWGTLYPTLEVLPLMREQHAGLIINITSIGGKVSVPHLLPYSCAKFAAVGFSEGLHTELAKEGIRVTTVVPGLMRTGSHINAFMKGKHGVEYALFGLVATLPFVSTSVASAARQIVQAARQGDTEVIITPQAQLLGRLHGLFPGFTSGLLTLVGRVLSPTSSTEKRRKTGQEVRSSAGKLLTALGEPAAHDYNQYAQQEI